jgi:hypothetical protein
VPRLSLIATLLITTWLVVLTGAGGAGASPDASPPLSTLLARHVPILVLHPAERLRPVAVEGFLADSDLFRKTPAGWERVEGPLPAGGADLRLDQRLCSARDGVAATACYVSAQAAHGSAPIVYGAAFRRRNRIDLQYWLWYPYNPYSPTVPEGELWQVHEGDWEAVSVIVDLRGRPLVVGYSQHGEGKRREWARAPKQGVRPRVYVALGSHANYFAPGKHPWDPRVAEPLLISIFKQAGQAPIDYTGRGPVVSTRLVRVTGSGPSWMAFAGTWGEDQYIHATGGQPVAAGTGPLGPAFHEQWRRPVAEVLSWPRG